MSADARVDAWAASWQTLNIAAKAGRATAENVDQETGEAAPLPDHYWAAMQAAATYAHLANAAPEIGEAAAEVLQEQERQRRESRDRIMQMFGRPGQ